VPSVQLLLECRLAGYELEWPGGYFLSGLRDTNDDGPPAAMQASSAWRITVVLPVQSKVKSAPPSVSATRVRTHWSEPEDDGGCDADG
jgi:hypothetical protein